jgi:chromosome segregation ATPase
MTDENQTLDESPDDQALWDEFEAAENPEASPPEEADEQTDNEAAETDLQLDPEPEQQTTDQSTDPWATAPETLKSQYQQALDRIAQLDHADRSNRSRVSALQRKIDELSKQAAPASPEKAAKQADDNIADLEQLREDFPEIANPIAAVIEKLRQDQASIAQKLGAIEAEKQTASAINEETLLTKAHPDWMTVGSDPGFAEWVQAQPRYVQEAFNRNADAIVDHQEAADIISRYKQSRGATPDKSTNLTDKRQRQLKAATTTRAKGPGTTAAPVSEDADPKALWDYWESVERKQSR